MKLVLVTLALALVAAVSALVPLEPYQDFQVVFHADMGLLRGILLYDRDAQVEMIAQIAGVSAAQVYVLPFPYPPWYALTTVWLARLPVTTAARTWFGLNLLMLMASVGLMTRGQRPLRRGLMVMGGLFWLPVLGSLIVGQYGFPVLLGMALMLYALDQEKPMVVALAAALLTFKPHLGLALIALVIARLLTRRDKFSRQAMFWLLAAAALLFGLGFLASPRWPMEYAASLMGFGSLHGVPECTQCVSLSVVLAGLVGGGLVAATRIALTLAMAACVWVVWRWRILSATPSGMVSIGALATLLVSPYLLKYDYVLLLAPIVALAASPLQTGEWIALALAYALPLAALALPDPAVSLALIASTWIVLALTLRQLKVTGSQGAWSAT